MSNLGTVLSGISALTSGGALPVANFASYLMTGQGLANHLPFIGPITQAAGNKLDAALQYEMGRDRGTPPPVTITPTVRAMNEGEQAMADQAMKQLRTFREGGNVDMGMTRAQLEEQIRGFANGGTPDPFQGYLTPAPPATGLPNPSPFRGYLEPATETEQERIDRLRKQAEEIIAKRQQEALDAQREKRDEAFTYGMERYKKQLAPLLSSSPRPTLFDLASDLGAAMLAAPADAGAFRSAGTGFAAFNERLRAHRQEKRQVDQQVALKAFELAKTDEKEAQDYLNQFSLKRLEIANRTPKYETYEYDYTDPTTGKVERRTTTINENSPADMALVLGGTDSQGRPIPPELPNAVQVKTPDVALSMGSQSKFADEQGKALSKSLTDMRTDYDAGVEQSRLIDMMNVIVNRLDDNVGLLEQKTLGPRKILDELGIRADPNISDQELLNTLGTRIAMQLIGDTKGAITEMEMRLFIAASPGLASSKEGLIAQADYLNRIARLNQKLFEDYNNDLDLADEMNAARDDAERNRIYNQWRARWQRQPENQFLSSDELSQLRGFAAAEPEAASAYRIKFGGEGKFETQDATGQGY